MWFTNQHAFLGADTQENSAEVPIHVLMWSAVLCVQGVTRLQSLWWTLSSQMTPPCTLKRPECR